MRPIYLLVDGGGTKTNIRVLDKEFNLIGESRSKSGNIKNSVEKSWKSVEHALSKVITKEETKNASISAVMGMAGYESKLSLKRFINLKPNFIKRLTILSDGEIACLGAHKGDDGSLVIIGTGIKGFQIEAGKKVEIAGWGFPYSDEGSGAWIGMEAVRLTLRSIDNKKEKNLLTERILSRYKNDHLKLLDHVSRASPKDFGDFFKDVVECSTDGDDSSKDLLKYSAREVERIIKLLEKKQNSKKILPLSLAGGASQYIEPYLTEHVLSRLKKSSKDLALDGAEYYLKFNLKKKE